MGLDTVELVISIEKKFSISIDDEDAAELGVVGDLVAYVVAKLKDENRTFSFDKVFGEIVNILVEDYGIPRDQINTKSHVVLDLGLD